jgi:hypothetical protein
MNNSMKTTRVEIECAVAAVLSVTLPLYVILTGRMFALGKDPYPLTLKDVWFLFICFASYASAPFLYRRIVGRRFRRVIPSWIFIALSGSLSFILIASLSGASFPFSGWEDMPIEFVYLAVYTMFVTGTVYYSGAGFRQLRGWYLGERENLSILRK